MQLYCNKFIRKATYLKREIMSDNELKLEQNPINTLWKDVLFLPIIGLVDSLRAQDIMDVMLEAIDNSNARFVILDIKGVVSVDSAVANHLIKVTKATKLLGCETILSGISPAVAQSLVHLGIDLGDLITTGRISDALSLAFNRLNLSVVSISDR